ncbi:MULTISPECIES: restriction endonuclease subunit S [Oscillospiraceae]|uniref:restriction endonuclease subunit S n=1 Tax=Oscillospiraceae TaxID=216572 RepID=UPI0015AC8606|nr:restriction endonuclease subunit S [Neglectibacter sp. CSJ-5]
MEPIASLITDYVANGSFASLKANVRTYKEKNYALFVRTVDFANNFKGDLSYIDKESYDFLEKSKLYGGELMLSNIGASIGKVFKVPHLDTPMSLAPNAIILRFFNDITCDYFEYVFKSFVGQNYLQFLSGGAAMPKFNKTDLRAMIVPVPPIKEQERIVESVKNTFIGIDDLDISYSGLANTIQSVKSKILDLAIRGKLVPQDPNDEPASVLLERIRAEKEELIKQGKIKRDKKESVIFKGDDNSYYEKYGEKLPSGWVVTNFETILEYEQPTKYIVHDTNYKPTYKTPVLTAGKSFILGYTNETDNIFDDLPVIIFDDFTTESKFVDFSFKVKSSAMKILHINQDLVLPKYAFYLMQATEIDHDNHQRYWISTYSQEIVALPPINEQERILTALEHYFNLLDTLQ